MRVESVLMPLGFKEAKSQSLAVFLRFHSVHFIHSFTSTFSPYTYSPLKDYDCSRALNVGCCYFPHSHTGGAEEMKTDPGQGGGFHTRGVVGVNGRSRHVFCPPCPIVVVQHLSVTEEKRLDVHRVAVSHGRTRRSRRRLLIHLGPRFRRVGVARGGGGCFLAAVCGAGAGPAVRHRGSAQFLNQGAE